MEAVLLSRTEYWRCTSSTMRSFFSSATQTHIHSHHRRHHPGHPFASSSIWMSYTSLRVNKILYFMEERTQSKNEDEGTEGGEVKMGSMCITKEKSKIKRKSFISIRCHGRYTEFIVTHIQSRHVAWQSWTLEWVQQKSVWSKCESVVFKRKEIGAIFHQFTHRQRLTSWFWLCFFAAFWWPCCIHRNSWLLEAWPHTVIHNCYL